MPKFICHHDGKFFEWSTIVDAPVTHAMSRADFEKYYQEEFGRRGMQDLPARLDRATKNGTSAMSGQTLGDLIACNRAGDDEDELTFDEVIALVNSESD